MLSRSACARPLLQLKSSAAAAAPSRLVLQFTVPRRTLTTLLTKTLYRPSLTTSSITFPSSSLLSQSSPSIVLSTTTRAFSTSPLLLAPRDTYNMTHRVRKRRHGFLSRIKTRKGRAILSRRRAKGRQSMSH